MTTSTGGAVFGIGWPRNHFGEVRQSQILFALCVVLLVVAGSFAGVGAQNARVSGQPQLVLKFKPTIINAVAWSPDGSTIATGTNYGAIKLWDAHSGAVRRVLDKGEKWDKTGDIINTLSFSPDGKLLASGDDFAEVLIWNVQTGALVRSLEREKGKRAHMNEVYCVAWSPDGKTLATAGLDKTAALWDVAAGTRLYTLQGHTDAISGVAFSPDGATLVSAGEDTKLWDARTGAPKGALPLKALGAQTTSAHDVAWSRDGALLAIVSDSLAMWNVRAQALHNEGKMPRLPFPSDIWTVTFSPDGTLVATGHGPESETRTEGDVLLWDARTCELKQMLRGHKGPVSDVTFSPDGKRLASTGTDGTLKIWSLVGNRSPVTLLPLPDRYSPADWLAMTEEGFYDSSDSSTMRDSLAWRVGREELPLRSFEGAFHRPDIVARLLQPEPIVANSEMGRLLAARSSPPSVAFVSSPAKEKVKGATVTLGVMVSDEVAVRRLEFRVNGRPVTATFSVGEPQEITEANRSQALAGKPAPASHMATLRYNVSVPLPPGESKVLVRAIARDASGLEGQAEVTIERELVARGMIVSTLSGEAAREAQRALQGNLHVLAVGVSRYKNTEHNLQYTVADANAFAALWPPMQERLYQKVLVTQLADDKATIPALKAELEALNKTTTNKDTVIIFMAGHGLRAKGQNFYFATHEANFEHPENTALPWTALTDVLAKVPAKRVVLFLDACHSGAALGSAQASNERMAETLVTRAGVMVFASSRGDQVSFESAEWQHGAFTKAVLEGIAEGKANLDSGVGQDGNITVAKLLVYLQARVPKLTKDQQHPACPLMQDFGEPFRLASAPATK